MQHPTEFGGQGLPKTIGAMCTEILNAANLSFALCPLLTDGAIEALLTAGSDAQKATYIPPMIEGRWTGTMNLTEPQAGSDLSLVRTRAEPQPDGTYKIFGTKICITHAEHDLALCEKYKVPIIITSLGAREDVNQAVHRWGGVVLHDAINDTFAHKAIDKGADGLIAVAAGAGGHAGTKSPFALIQEIRRWFDGPLALAGAIATGGSILAAQAMGADFAYIGSLFIATDEARASEACKQCIVECTSDDIVYTNLLTGVHGNYLKPSIRAAGLDLDHLPQSDPSKMIFASAGAKAWKDIWGCGQGIAVVNAVRPAAQVIERLKREYAEARARLRGTAG